MVTNNKVLTVSYGTFSCTLEGFDDSFDTMKAIAEYFRDLAADDRYFGAEPPTPDAEMLARIAERETERRVQARTEHGAIVLSAATAADAIETSAETDEVAIEETGPALEEAPVEISQEEAVEEVVAETKVDEAPEVVEPAVFAEEDDQPQDNEPAEMVETPEPIEVVAAQEETGIAADLASAAEEVVEEAEIENTEVEEVLAEDLTEGEDTIAAVMSRIDPEAEDAAEIDAQDESEEFEANQDDNDTLISSIVEAEESADGYDEDEPVAEYIEPVATISPEADDDSISAKLQRIRAVVSKTADMPDEDDFSEDEHAENMTAEQDEQSSSVLRLDEDMAIAEDAASDEHEDTAEAEETDAEGGPVRARVIRMKRADFEAAVGTGLLEAVAEEDELDGDAEEAGLSPEDEAELLAELAQVESELDSDDQEDDDLVEAIGADLDDEDPTSSRGQYLAETGHDAEADMARLMNEAQNQLNEPGGSRRRQAIAHLRAAVAATKAEQDAGGSMEPGDASEVYRDDLASVVRPVTTPEAEDEAEEPMVADSAPERPTPAPLKLVAEQRIDTPEEQPAAAAEETPRAPVRPRRVSAVDRKQQAEPAGPGEADGGFAEFAESVGAHQLHEILEAAASYLTYVKGRDVFSRPMVMRMVRGYDEESFSREDSLRGFGQLLRENKIEKVSGGRFSASDRLGFKPQDRAAG